LLKFVLIRAPTISLPSHQTALSRSIFIQNGKTRFTTCDNSPKNPAKWLVALLEIPENLRDDAAMRVSDLSTGIACADGGNVNLN